jgi:DNA adenine methylase
MRYLGGKCRIAKELVAALPLGLLWWEPFVGGANVTPHLRPVLISDARQALASLYTAVRDGWDPPSTLSEAEYQAYRALPEFEPLHAFAAAGCSFGGKWWGGYARGAIGRRYDKEAREALLSLRPVLRQVACLDFCTCAAPSGVNAIYCDPPYAGTTGYRGLAFDHGAFWSRCHEYAAAGWYVAVSEYSCPVKHVLLWEKRRNLEMHGKDRAAGRVERLFRVLP